MSKKLLREYYALCDGGVCQDLLTEEEKKIKLPNDLLSQLTADDAAAHVTHMPDELLFEQLE